MYCQMAMRQLWCTTNSPMHPGLCRCACEWRLDHTHERFECLLLKLPLPWNTLLRTHDHTAAHEAFCCRSSFPARLGKLLLLEMHMHMHGLHSRSQGWLLVLICCILYESGCRRLRRSRYLVPGRVLWYITTQLVCGIQAWHSHDRPSSKTIQLQQ